MHNPGRFETRTEASLSLNASLKIFLTALAVIDDLGAIIIIAIFYTGNLSVIDLLIALSVFAVLLVFNRLKIHNLIPYIIGGIVMWYFMLQSGVHATIAGVLLAFAVPFGDGSERSPSYRLQHVLHKPVAFIIVLAFYQVLLQANQQVFYCFVLLPLLPVFALYRQILNGNI